MYRVRFEGKSTAVEAIINQLAPVMNKVVAEAAKEGVGTEIRARWFKTEAGSGSLSNQLRQMDEYLNKQCSVLSFVVKQVNQLVDRATVEATDYAQVINAPIVSSGTRIYILPNFVSQPASEKLNTLCHELSHRVLGTTDCPNQNNNPVYGRGNALALGGAQSTRCAEVFGYFYMDLAEDLGLLDN